MPNTWLCMVRGHVVLLVLLTYWSCSLTDSTEIINKKTLKQAESLNFKPVNLIEYEDYNITSAELFDEESYGESMASIKEVTGSPILSCDCKDHNCISEDLGRGYMWQEIPTTVTNIKAAVDYVDDTICREDFGFQRVALETAEELNFIVDCLLCNNQLYFGTSMMKWNIMTAGEVNVTTPGLQPYEVLRDLKGVWSTWDKEVNGDVPSHVFLLDPNSGTQVLGAAVPEGYYSILLVGNNQLLCNKYNKDYLNWGLMSHEADGPILKLVHYVNGVELCPGKTLLLPCPSNYSGEKEIQCIKGEEIIEDRCIADWINNVDSMINLGNTSVVDIAEILKNDTDNESSITQADLTCLVSVISNMTSLLELQIENIESNDTQFKQELVHNYTSQLVKIEGNIFTNEDVWDGLDTVRSGKLGSSLLHDLEKTGFILATNVKEDMLNFTDPTLNLTVLSKPRNELAGRELYFPGHSSDTFIRLPDDFEEQLPPGEAEGHVVGFFLNQKAASRALPAALSSLPNKQDTKEINSFLVSMTLGSLNNSVNFTSEVILRLQHAYKESGPIFRDLYRLPREGEVPSRIPGSAVCVYWDPKTSGWAPTGCKLINSSRDVTYCSCSHLSMISVITDVHNYMGRDVALDILGTVLSFLSCIALLAAASILQFCRGVEASQRVSITKQLCVSLFLSHLCLILFLDRDFLKLSEAECKVMAGVLHYLLTASICWMLAEGLQLFHTVHFTLDPTSFMVVYWLIGYGVPAVVVVVTLLTAFGSDQWNTQEAYAPYDSEYCWLSTDEGYIWAFTGPLVVVIVVNAIFMVLAIRSAAILTANRRKTLHHKVLLFIKGSFSLNCVLGVTWVFGLLYINSNHFFAYVFTIFNASQGVMIFVFNCRMNDNVWTAFISSLPKTIKKHLMKPASDMGPTSGKMTLGDSSVYNKSSKHHTHHNHRNHHHHHHDYNQQTDHHHPQSNYLLNPWPRSYLPESRAKSHPDMIEIERSRRYQGWREEEEEEDERRRPSLPSHVISEAFRRVASPAHRSSNHYPDLTHQTSRSGSVPSRVSPPDQRINRRKASQWSADTQITVISDGGMSRKSSMESFYNEDHSPSTSSTSSCSSVSQLPPFPNSMGESMRGYTTYKEPFTTRPEPIEEVLRRIHTIPECEERSPSSDNTFTFIY